MMLLRVMALARARDWNQHRQSSEREAANMHGESYDRASLFRGRKFRLGEDCCKTIAPQATSARRDRRSLPGIAIRIAREKCARRSAAGWQSRQSGGKTALPAFRR